MAEIQLQAEKVHIYHNHPFFLISIVKRFIHKIG